MNEVYEKLDNPCDDDMKNHIDEKIHQFYDVGKVLGRGSFSVVFEAKSRASGDDCALKVVKYSQENPNDSEQSTQEYNLLKNLEHPNIVKMIDLVKTKSGLLHLVMEIAFGGELFDKIVERGSYSEKDASVIMKQICLALKYLHAKSIIHRDLKPENLLFATCKDESAIKISDFGMASVAGDNFVLSSCGTPTYVAPEVLSQDEITPLVDMWSVGVIMYILLCGFPPFFDENPAALFQQILLGEFDFPTPYWDDISDSAKDLISNLLVVDLKTRFSAERALLHPWIAGADVPTENLPTVLKQMKKFNARRKFKASIAALQAVSRFRRASDVFCKRKNPQ